MTSRALASGLYLRHLCGFSHNLLLLFVVGIAALVTHKAMAQYSTRALTNSTEFPTASQSGFGQPISTDGTWVAYSSGDALWSQPIGGGTPKKLFSVGTTLPGSSQKAALIYGQTGVSEGTVVFLATDGGGGNDGLFGLYSVKADGSVPAKRVADSTIAPIIPVGGYSNSTAWYDVMDLYGVYGVFQVSKDVVVFAIQGALFSANTDGSNLKTLWEALPKPGFQGCSTAGDYHDIFLTDEAYQPATDGKSFVFNASSYLDFVALYEGPLTSVDTCNDLINSGLSIDDGLISVLPGQPKPGKAFSFPQGQDIQIDGDYVYFGASSAEGVSSKVAYNGYFKIPLAGGPATPVVTNISHVPGLKNPDGSFAQVNLYGFAVNNGKLIFLAQDVAGNDPVAFYMVDGSDYVKLFKSGTSVDNQCVGGLETGNLGGLNGVSLSSDGQLVFSAEELLTTPPDLNGLCNDFFRFQPIGYFVLDTTHPMIPTVTKIEVSPSTNATWGESPTIKVSVAAAEGASNPKSLVPTGTVNVYYTNPLVYGVQTQGSATIDAEGNATIKAGEVDNGIYTYSVSYGGDSNFSSSASIKVAVPIHVTKPTFTLAAGTYSSPQSVYINDSTPGSTIYYTLNGETPTTKSTEFVSSIPITSTVTLKAIAGAVGDIPSAVASATYEIVKPGIAPVFSPGTGTYSAGQKVKISDAAPGATIYYALHGATPTTKSTKYTGPIVLSTSETIKAIAVAPGYSDSPIASATFTVK